MLPGYAVHDRFTMLAVGLFLLSSLLLGYAITRLRGTVIPRCLTWIFVVVSVVFVERMTTNEPSGTRMLAIIVGLLWAMKVVVGVESRVTKKIRLTFIQWICFVVFWFGMRPGLFASLRNPVLPQESRSDWSKYAKRGVIQLLIGLALYPAAKYFWFLESFERWWTQSIATALVLASFSMVIHFGLFNLLVAWWRSRGVNCTSLFRAPLYSTSLSEFWGRRWNLAFSEMTALTIFRPLRNRLGIGMAMSLAFLFSGLLHELAISVPVKAGFGLPMLYFAIHGIGMIIEKMIADRNVFNGQPSQLFGNEWLGRIWTVAWIVVPLPILFHRAFLEGCVWPLFTLGASHLQI